MTEELTGAPEGQAPEAQPPKRKKRSRGFSASPTQEMAEVSQVVEVESTAEEVPEVIAEEPIAEQQVAQEPEEEKVSEAPRNFVPPVRPLQGSLLRSGKRGEKRAGLLSR